MSTVTTEAFNCAGALLGDLVTWARVQAAAVIEEPSLARKRVHAQRMVVALERAESLEAVLRRLGSCPRLLDSPEGERVDPGARTQRCRELLAGRPVMAHVARSFEHALDGLELSPVKPPAGRGPHRPALDPVFAPAEGISAEFRMPRSAAEHAPHFWLMALREGRVADLCALSLFEQEGMPLGFYLDLACQCWDELRHAELMLACATDVVAAFAAGDRGPLGRGAQRFVDSGEGMPVPSSADLYPALWQAPVAQRIALVQAGDEADLPAQLTADLDNEFFRAHPHRADELRWTIREEESHVRAGARWLAALCPGEGQVDDAKLEARLLRAFYVASAAAEAHGVSIHQELAELAARPLTTNERAGGP